MSPQKFSFEECGEARSGRRVRSRREERTAPRALTDAFLATAHCKGLAEGRAPGHGNSKGPVSPDQKQDYPSPVPAFFAFFGTTETKLEIGRASCRERV